MIAELTGLTLVAVGTALIVTSPPAPPVYAPARAGAAGDTPLPFAFTEFPPEPTRLKTGRRVLLTGLGVTALGLVVRWAW